MGRGQHSGRGVIPARARARDMADLALLSVPELELKLLDAEKQLESVRALLAENPQNESLGDLVDSLGEMVALLSDLIETKRAESNSSEAVPRPPYVVIGARILARYEADGKMYESIVREVREHECVVQFIGYKDLAAVRFEHVQPAPKRGPTAAAAAAAAAKAASEKREHERGDAGDDSDDDFGVPKTLPACALPIPERLKVLPTDSEKVRTRKLRKIHAIETHNERLRVEQAHAQRQSSWQMFQSRGRSRTSIFRSPDGVDGRVGVTGSGRSMTTYSSFDTRNVKNSTPGSAGDE